MEPLFNDETILERSKVWSTAMAEFCKKETFAEIEFKEIESDSEEMSDDNAPNETIINNNNEKMCNALVKVDNFEGDTSSDDFDECANQTLTMLKDHQNKWDKFGMIDVLQTFDLDKISKVVVPWVEKNKLDKSLHSTSVDEHIVHIEEHHHRQIHVASDDDSLHSLDTANYIRSSRKKKSSSCTTTTIKKFSYVKGSRRNLQKKYGLGNFDLNKEVDKIFNEKYPENVEKIAQRGLTNVLSSEKKPSPKCTPPMRSNPIEYEPRSLPENRRRSRQLKRRSDISKRSVSSSSSSSCSPARPPKHKFKKSFKINNENKLESGTRLVRNNPILPKEIQLGAPKHQNIKNTDYSAMQVDLTKMETSDSESKFCPKKPTNSHSKPQPKFPDAIQGASSSNETGFLGTSIINSTALSNTNQPSLPNPVKMCLITPIKNKQELEHPKEQSIKHPKIKLPRINSKKVENVVEPKEIVPKETEQTKVPEDNTKILLYCPTNREPHQKNLSGKRFYLTHDYFFETVGKKNSRRFIKLNSKKFPFVFDCSSSIYFKVPEESEDESECSDEDIFDIFGREGKIIVETVEQKNNTEICK